MKNKQSNKATFKFFGIMVLSAIGGGLASMVVIRGADGLSNMLLALSAMLQKNSPIFLAANLTLVVASFCFYQKGKRFALSAVGDNEAAYEKADSSYGTALNLASVSFILGMIFYGFSASTLAFSERKDFPNMVAATLLFITTFTLGTVMQTIIIKATKELYPEKRGNVLDMKFQKDWLNSCDEAEKKLIGESAYKSYTIIMSSLPCIFVVCMLLGFVVNLGITPYIIIGVVWLIASQSYYFYAKGLATSVNINNTHI